MIHFTTGDIMQADCDALVNPVNCVGVMGKGLALEVKKAFPNVFKEYKDWCDIGMIAVGCTTIHKTGVRYPRYVINFPTKQHWKSPSEMKFIRNGLTSLVIDIKERPTKDIMSIAVPKLGCGNGGLQWTDVKPLIIAAAAELPLIDFVIFE
jgi:O-acetyl-ADP-ribose deacetylase (regulator of RNase III)